MKQVKNNQDAKARLGAIGESLVVAKLMQQGWDAFNANCTIKNYKSIDIICLNSDLREEGELSWKPKTALVQVKTCSQKNIPVGFTLEQSLNKEYLEHNVKGPYVFVYANKNEDYEYDYFIISRNDFIELLYSSNYWYVHEWNREKSLNLSSPAGLYIRWLMGKDEEETPRHKAFKNPLNGVSCENIWANIWKK